MIAPVSSVPVRTRTVSIDGVDVFVREAGDTSAPAIVLLHGFPTSSLMFRELIPRLARSFRVIAPDLVGYGFSSAPPPSQFEYTFDNLAAVTRKLLAKLEVTSYVLYVHDYGGPVGFRIAASEPGRVRGLVIQNANAYLEGVSELVAGLFMPLWKEQTPATIAAARGFLTAEATKGQYTTGARDVAALDPAAWTMDQALLDRPGNDAVQLALFVDYETNVALYDQWHAYFRANQPKTLILWGKGDPFFLVPGAHAYQRDLPGAEIVLLDGGHFALEEHADTIAAHILRTFAQPTAADVVRGFYAELAEGKLDAALARLAADVSWNDPEGFPYGGKLRGPAEVKEKVFAKLLADWSPFAVEASAVDALEGKNDVLGVGRYLGTSKATGRGIDLPFTHLWTVERGVITRFETYTDTATMRAALGR